MASESQRQPGSETDASTAPSSSSSISCGSPSSASSPSPQTTAASHSPPRCHAAWLLLGTQNTGKSYALRQLLHLVPFKRPVHVFSADPLSFSFLPSDTVKYPQSPEIMQQVEGLLTRSDHVTVVIDDFPPNPSSVRLLRTLLNITLPKSNSCLFLSLHNLTHSFSLSSFIMIFDKIIIPLNKLNGRLHQQLIKILGHTDDAWPMYSAFQSQGIWCYDTGTGTSFPFYYSNDPQRALSSIVPPSYARAVRFLLNTLPDCYLAENCLTFGNRRVHLLDFLMLHTPESIQRCQWYKKFAKILWKDHRIALPSCLFQRPA